MAKPFSNLELLPLSQCPEHLGQVAAWVNSEREQAGLLANKDQGHAKLAEHLTGDGPPLTVVALEDGRPIASASLVYYRFTERHEGDEVEVPWLSNVYVKPDFRQRGLGNHLVDHLERWACGRAFPQLKLFTADKQNFYLRRGWSRDYLARLGGKEVDVMSIDLSARA